MIEAEDVSHIIESLPIALLTTDDKRRIVGANSAAGKLFGYQLSELLGQPLELLIPERFAARHPELYESFVRNPSSREMGGGRDLAALRSDGTEFPVEVALTVLSVEPPRYMASILDITYRKQTEKLLREKQEFLESSLQETQSYLEEQIAEKTRLEERQRLGRELHDSLSQNLYGIGLGLRTALAQQKKGADPSEPLEYCLNLTEASLVEMRALLFKLRPKSLENVPLADVLTSHTQAVAARTRMPIDFEEYGDNPGELNFDKKYALYRVVTEALHNSVKHAKGCTVTVRLHNERAEVRAEVLDNGGGFNPDAVSTGHGLATMRERIEAVGGRLDLQSSGDGTAVKAVVPRFSHI